MTADEAIAVQRDVTDVYRAAFGAPPYNEGEAQVQQFRDDMLPRHTQRDGFRFVVALESGRVVGFAYGYTGERGQWWTDTVAKAMPAELAEKWLGGHFESFRSLFSRSSGAAGSAPHFTMRYWRCCPTARPYCPPYRSTPRRCACTGARAGKCCWTTSISPAAAARQ